MYDINDKDDDINLLLKMINIIKNEDITIFLFDGYVIN